MFRKIIDTTAYVKSFSIGQEIILLTENRIEVHDSKSFRKTSERAVFDADGKTQFFVLDERLIYCRDFTRFLVLERSSLDPVADMQLGTDLSSDICAMAVDDGHCYASIRNGGIARIPMGD